MSRRKHDKAMLATLALRRLAIETAARFPPNPRSFTRMKGKVWTNVPEGYLYPVGLHVRKLAKVAGRPARDHKAEGI